MNSNANKPFVSNLRYIQKIPAMSHCLSLETLEEDNSVPKVLIRVPDIISSMIALVGNDMSLGGLSELTIY